MPSIVVRLALALVLVVASAQLVSSDNGSAPPVDPELAGLEATVSFLGTAITPDQQTIDYLGSIDLGTGLPPVPEADPSPAAEDPHGRARSPDRLCTLSSHWSFVLQFLACTPDGRRIVGARVTCPPTIVVCDRFSGRCVRQLWHGGRVGGISLSPDGRTVAAAVCATGGNRQRNSRVSLWNIDSGQLIGTVADGASVSAVAFMPDGETLVTGGEDGLVQLWSLAGTPPRCLGKHNREITAVAVAPDGRTVASGSKDCTVRLWNSADGEELRQLLHPKEVSFVTFAPDGRTLACINGGIYWNLEGTTYLWEVSSGKELPHFQHHPAAGMGVGFSGDSRLPATSDPSGVYVWEVATGQVRQVVDKRADAHRALLATATVLSPDGRAVVASGSLTAVWDVTSRSPTGHLVETQFTARGLEDLWQSLGARDAARAHAAVWALVAARASSVELLGDRLSPAAAVDLERIKRLVGELDDARFDIRQAAGRELEGLDDVRVADVLRQTLADMPSLELQRRSERVLVAVTSAASPERARALRAVEVLERIGTPEALACLERVAGGAADSYLTRAARGAVERLTRP
jgi:hypothetical protein